MTATNFYVDQEARGLHRFDLGPTSNVPTAHTSKSSGELVSLILVNFYLSPNGPNVINANYALLHASPSCFACATLR